MSRAKVVLNSAGMKALLNDPGVRADLTRRMGPVLSEAISSAPVGATGEHKASIHMEQATTDRAVVRVVADSDHSLGAEANTGHMARSLNAAGGT